MTTKTAMRRAITPAKDIPPGPRGLGGYCWEQDPATGVHCCEPVWHKEKSAEHHNPYTKTRWR